MLSSLQNAHLILQGMFGRGHHYGKTSFVEHRTFLHLYHSFHRLWMFLIMMFQVNVNSYHSIITGLHNFVWDSADIYSFVITSLNSYISFIPSVELLDVQEHN
jgi:callose synthase